MTTVGVRERGRAAHLNVVSEKLGALLAAVLVLSTASALSVRADDPTWFEPGRYFVYRIVWENKRPNVTTEVTVANLTLVGVNATHVTLRSIFALESNLSQTTDVTYEVVRLNRSIPQIPGKKVWLWLRTEEAGPGTVQIAGWNYTWNATSISHHIFDYSSAGNTSRARFDKTNLWLTDTTNHVFGVDPFGATTESWVNQTLTATGVGPNPGPTPPEPLPELPLIGPRPPGGSSAGGKSGGGGNIQSLKYYPPPWFSAFPVQRSEGQPCLSHLGGWQDVNDGHYATDARVAQCGSGRARRDRTAGFDGPGVNDENYRFNLPFTGYYRFQWHFESSGWLTAFSCQFTTYSLCSAVATFYFSARIYRLSDSVAQTPTFFKDKCTLWNPGTGSEMRCQWGFTHTNLLTGYRYMLAGSYYWLAYANNGEKVSVSGSAFAEAHGHVDGVEPPGHCGTGVPYCGGLHNFNWESL